MSERLLEFAGVSWAPPEREQPLFAGLDLALGPGELTVLTSGLGGGKSSALRLAVGLERPRTGSVAVCGRPPAEVRRAIGYVGGEGALLANLSLYDNLVLPLRWLDDPPEDEVERRAREALSCFGVDALPAVAPAYAPTNLRRLVALARAMIMRPQVLVLDEPAADFDADSADEVWQHLADLALAHGMAVLAAATSPPRRGGFHVHILGGAAAPTTRRFSPDQRRTALQQAVPHGPSHPSIIARKHP